MITVQFMKPFYTKMLGTKLRLVFAYQYFSIMKDEEVYHFIPIEGKEMVIDLNTLQVENLSEVFVFQRGNRFIRLPLYQLILVSNVQDYLMPVIENASAELPQKQAVANDDALIDTEVMELIQQLEEKNVSRLIDTALADRDEAMFYHLILTKQNLNKGYAL